MHDDWDMYFTHVDDKPACMVLDLGLEAPIPGLSVLAYVTVDFRQADENGLCGRGEGEKLLEIENALYDALTGEACLFVGHCSCNGSRDFFFYMENAKGVEEKIESLLNAFPTYTWDMGLVEEPGWDTYLEFLYPDEQGMDTIWNNRARRQLQEEGDNPALPRPLSHQLSFASAQDRAAFMAEAAKEGFSLSPQEDDPENPFGLLALRTDAPDDIDDVTWPLRELAGAHGGTYNGWTCA